MREIAKQLVTSGTNVIPLQADKRPVGNWAAYQKVMFNDFTADFVKMGLVCGSVSGGVEVIDIDLKYDIKGDLYENFRRFIAYNDKTLLDKLLIQKTVSNGYHFVYRCKTIEGNKKLASRYATEEEQKIGDKIHVLLETRGEGGYIVMAPSGGYEVIQGDFMNIPEITEREREILMCSARALNQIDSEVYEPPKKQVEWADNGLTPWDDYNERGNALDLLEAHGWTRVHGNAKRVMLKRPGATSAKTSGNFLFDKCLFKSWSTSTVFEAQKAYNPSAVFAILECNGDFKEAGRKLYELGYGERSEIIAKRKEEAQKDNEFDFISLEDDEIGYLNDFYLGKIKKGLSTGFPGLDKHFVWKNGNFVIVNGHANVGKSTVLWYLMVLNNLLHGWKWIIYSSENREASVRRRLVEFRFGKDYNKLSMEEIGEGKRWAYDNFVIIKGDTIENYESIIVKCEKLMRLKPFKGLLIDPYNSLDTPTSNTHEFHYKAATAFRLFAKNFDCTTVINMHAVTSALRIKDNEGHPVAPTMADTEGGGKFGNRADDFITLHRLTQDMMSNTVTQIHIRKIKETETGGLPTGLDNPIKLEMSNNGFFGFYDPSGLCPLKHMADEWKYSQGIKAAPVTQETIDYYEKDTKTFDEVEADFLGEAREDCPF
jgi:KaiC/GvpD/RAD55 family RecA-like ATPase